MGAAGDDGGAARLSRVGPTDDAVTATADTRLRKRSVTIAGHRTSISLEEAFWEALKDIAVADGLSLNALVARIDADRTGNLSSGLRVFVLRRLRDQAGSGNSPSSAGVGSGGTTPSGSGASSGV